jgi:hypothetical protein
VTHAASDRPGRLYGLAISWRLLITMFVLVLGAGYLNGALNAALAVGLTPRAIAGHYRDQTLSQAEAAVVAKQGFVEQEVNLDQLGTEPAPEAAPAGAGGGGAAMDMGGGGDTDHAMGMGKSITAQQLAQLAHVHLLGFALILFSVGGLACLTSLSEGVKSTLVVVLGLCLGADIGGLWLVRFVSEGFAWLTAAAGVGIGVCVALTFLRVLWEIWGPVPERARG